MSTAFWCEQAWLGPSSTARHDGVVITVDGDVITTVETGVPTPPAEATRLAGVTVPGFANVHSHAFHRALRGRTHGGAGTFWTWREQMYALAASLDPDRYERLATAAFGEMVLAGYTVVGEFHYLHHQAGAVPYADPNEMGRRLLRAADRVGLRVTLLDTCYLDGGIGVAADEVQQRFSDRTAQNWTDRVAALTGEATTQIGPLARVGAAVHSVRAVDPPAIARVAEWARRHGAVLHAHVSEQPKENEDALAAYGRTPVELLSEHAQLDERFCAVHATHLTDLDVELLTNARASCCICPTTERDLADGIGPTAALAAARLCIGSDSHAVIDPFEEARAVELDERLRCGWRGTHSPVSLLAAATTNGYVALGWRGGEIAAGNLADFVTVGFNSSRLAGADRDDIVSALVFGATASDVQDVVIGGEHVVRGGAHGALDVVAALDRSIADVWSAT